MKIIFFLFALLTSIVKGNTQIMKPKYDTCSHLLALTGEWLSVSGVDTIRIYLRAHRSHSASFNATTDDLWGWIEYKKGSKIIESTYPNRYATLPFETDNLPQNFESLSLRADSCLYPVSSLYGTIVDFSQGKEIKKVKATINVNGTVMFWKQQHLEGYGFVSGFTGMTLPKEFTLIKQ